LIDADFGPTLSFPVKLQTTVNGHTSWAIARLAKRKGKTNAEIASSLLDRFFEENSQYLRDNFITFEQYGLENPGASGGEIVAIDGSMNK
jgi:hypothetical protein